MMVEYDACGKMKYHPDFHSNQGKKWTEEDLEYLCKYHEVDSLEVLALALERTTASTAEKVTKLKKQNLFEYYRNLNKHW